MGTISTLERPRPRVTLTIPAESVDDFRVGVLADLEKDAGGFTVEHANMLDASEDRRDMCREDRDGFIRGIRETGELLAQLPTEDVETTVAGTTESLRFALEEAGRLLTDRVRRLFEYGPVPVEDVLPLVDRLQWTLEQAAAVEQGV
jgi:hypothetical protein